MARPELSPAARRRPLISRLLLAAGNPLDWSTADKVVLAALVPLPFTVWFWVWEYYALTHPSFAAPYLDHGFMRTALGVQNVLIVGWTGLALTARWLGRRSSDNKLLPIALGEFTFIALGLLSYLLGHYTTPFGGITGLTGAIIAILLFERWIAAAGILSFLVVVLTTTVAEQIGLLPHAPFFRGPPLETGRVAIAYLLLVGIPMFAILGVGAILAFYIVDRWRDRDAKLEHTSDQLARANDVISRYVASQIAQQILAGNHDFLGRHERRRLTLFFSDIKDFAEIADHVEPEDLSELLNEYLSEMALIGERYGGTIDKFVGDAIMIFFGAPEWTNDRDHAVRAVKMAIEMQERIANLRDRWIRSGFERAFDVRMGINTGQATIGSFGSRVRLDYTAIGRQVNLAARLQASCAPGKVLISHSTWVLVREEIACEPKGEIQVKGFQNPVNVYEVIGAQTADLIALPRVSR